MTRKLKLEPEELVVETFAADDDDAAGSGTVEAREAPTIPPWCKTEYTLWCPCTPRADEV